MSAESLRRMRMTFELIENSGRLAVAAEVPADDVCCEVIQQLEGVVLKLVNNTLRACGVEVEDPQSERHSSAIDETISRLCFNPIAIARRESEARDRARDLAELEGLERRVADLRARLGCRSATPACDADNATPPKPPKSLFKAPFKKAPFKEVSNSDFVVLDDEDEE